VHQVGNECIVNSWCTVRKNIKLGNAVFKQKEQ